MLPDGLRLGLGPGQVCRGVASLLEPGPWAPPCPCSPPAGATGQEGSPMPAAATGSGSHPHVVGLAPAEGAAQGQASAPSVSSASGAAAAGLSEQPWGPCSGCGPSPLIPAVAAGASAGGRGRRIAGARAAQPSAAVWLVLSPVPCPPPCRGAWGLDPGWRGGRSLGGAAPGRGCRRSAEGSYPDIGRGLAAPRTWEVRRGQAPGVRPEPLSPRRTLGGGLGAETEGQLPCEARHDGWGQGWRGRL